MCLTARSPDDERNSRSKHTELYKDCRINTYKSASCWSVYVTDHDARYIQWQPIQILSLDDWQPITTLTRQTSVHPAGFEPTIPAIERPQTYALDRAVNGTYIYIFCPSCLKVMVMFPAACKYPNSSSTFYKTRESTESD